MKFGIVFYLTITALLTLIISAPLKAETTEYVVENCYNIDSITQVKLASGLKSLFIGDTSRVMVNRATGHVTIRATRVVTQLVLTYLYVFEHVVCESPK
jgi:hypothetical protein